MNWQFISNPDLRDQCDHVWVMDFISIEGKAVHSERRCEREGKFQQGDEYRCGYHTPNVGRKGPIRVPQDNTSRHAL